jgi:hypothetical protein
MKLTEFAVTEEQGAEHKTRCKTCNLPPEILQQVHEARVREPKPISFPTISKWLKTEGHEITQATIRNHFVAGHDNA